MDKTIFVIEGVGEYGLDVDHSPGVGGYYVKLYDGSYDVRCIGLPYGKRSPRGT